MDGFYRIKEMPSAACGREPLRRWELDGCFPNEASAIGTISGVAAIYNRFSYLDAASGAHVGKARQLADSPRS